MLNKKETRRLLDKAQALSGFDNDKTIFLSEKDLKRLFKKVYKLATWHSDNDQR